MSITNPAIWTDRHLARAMHLRLPWLRAELEAGRLPGIRQDDGSWLLDPHAIEDALLKRARQLPTQPQGGER